MKVINIGKSETEIKVDYDFELPEKWCLSITPHGYVIMLKSTGEKRKSGTYIYKREYLSRYITSCPKKLRVIHIDNDKTNLQRSNLVIVSQKVTTRTKAATTGRFKGVYFCKRRIKWIAQITHNYKTFNLGGFDYEEHAASAYNQAAVRIHGAHAYVNVLSDDVKSLY